MSPENKFFIYFYCLIRIFISIYNLNYKVIISEGSMTPRNSNVEIEVAVKEDK